MSRSYYTVVGASFGALYITADNNAVKRIDMTHPAVGSAARCDEHPIVLAAADAIKAYLRGETTAVSLSHDIPFLPFQQTVFTRVCRIPYGEVVTCDEIARGIGKPQSAHAVKAVCLSNPLWIAIPTHRVLLSNDCPSHKKPLCAAEALRRMEKRYANTP